MSDTLFLLVLVWGLPALAVYGLYFVEWVWGRVRHG
jgi:hypothetical protein